MVKVKLKAKTGGLELDAYFNPTDVKLKKSVPWNKHQLHKGDNPVLEFTDSKPEELEFELMFDGYVNGVNVYTKYIETLLKMTRIDASLKTPPIIRFIWSGFQKFEGVIQSLGITYTMFFDDGSPARATASISMMQAWKTQPAQGVSKGTSPGTDDGVLLAQGENRADKVGAKLGQPHRVVMDKSAPDGESVANALPPGTQVDTSDTAGTADV